MMGNRFPRKKRTRVDTSSLLDQIASQADIGNRNALYKLANYQKGGALLEVYEKGGSKDIKQVARETFVEYMYEDGQGTILTKDKYEEWRQRNNGQVVIEVGSPATHQEKFEERKICWRLECRGLLGESLLHVLIFCNTAVHTRIARVLLRIFPQLVHDIIEGSEYYGASALHLAIAYQNSDLVRQLMDCGANIIQRARGRFFMPHDQQPKVPKKQTDFSGLFYMGEYPLAWAACCEDESSYNLLLRRGADPNMQDSFGNMILHVVVIRDKLTMYGYALRHPTRPANDRILNKYGLTPLTLACKLGRNKIFREMLELSAMEFWRYSNITCSGYPLNALDSLQPDGQTNWNSALMLILSGKTNEHLDMLDGGVIQRLLEEKWKTFARHEFLKRLAFMFLHLITMSLAVYLRPSIQEPLLGPPNAVTVCRYFTEIATCMECVGFVIFQEAQEIKTQGLLGFLHHLSSNPPKAIFLFSDICVVLCIPCRFLGYRMIEDFLLSLALPGSWFFLIFFAGAVRLTGPFITMIYSMLVGDMFRFSIIYVIFLLGFSPAFHFLFKNPVIPKNITEEVEFPEHYHETWMSLFHMTLGVYEYGHFAYTPYHLVTRLVFMAFMVIMPILLLNMLIAMMGNTYCEVITQSEREWVRQWAKIVIALERAVKQDQAREYMQSYSIKLPSSSPDGEGGDEVEQRAVMVIKSKSKSKAKQRKGALSNWKRLCKRLVTELRQCGGTAEGVRAKFPNKKGSFSGCGLRIFHVKGDDSDEGGGAGTAKDSLGNTLDQLAFTHNLELYPGDVEKKDSSPPGSPPSSSPRPSFTDLYSQLAFAHDIATDHRGPPRPSVSSVSSAAPTGDAAVDEDNGRQTSHAGTVNVAFVSDDVFEEVEAHMLKEGPPVVSGAQSKSEKHCPEPPYTKQEAPPPLCWAPAFGDPSASIQLPSQSVEEPPDYSAAIKMPILTHNPPSSAAFELEMKENLLARDDRVKKKKKKKRKKPKSLFYKSDDGTSVEEGAAVARDPGRESVAQKLKSKFAKSVRRKKKHNKMERCVRLQDIRECSESEHDGRPQSSQQDTCGQQQVGVTRRSRSAMEQRRLKRRNKVRDHRNSQAESCSVADQVESSMTNTEDPAQWGATEAVPVAKLIHWDDPIL